MQLDGSSNFFVWIGVPEFTIMSNPPYPKILIPIKSAEAK